MHRERMSSWFLGSVAVFSFIRAINLLEFVLAEPAYEIESVTTFDERASQLSVGNSLSKVTLRTFNVKVHTTVKT